jgi:hypothetical protein
MRTKLLESGRSYFPSNRGVLSLIVNCYAAQTFVLLASIENYCSDLVVATLPTHC